MQDIHRVAVHLDTHGLTRSTPGTKVCWIVSQQSIGVQMQCAEVFQRWSRQCVAQVRCSTPSCHASPAYLYHSMLVASSLLHTQSGRLFCCKVRTVRPHVSARVRHGCPAPAGFSSGVSGWSTRVPRLSIQAAGLAAEAPPAPAGASTGGVEQPGLLVRAPPLLLVQRDSRGV